jgi:hypothetical protein
MEFLHNDYLINFNSNIDDFRINIYNKLNNKKYELIESQLVFKYRDIGVDIFLIITDCLANTEDNYFALDDNNKYITLKLIHGKFIKLSLIIPNVLCEYKDATILDLKTEIEKMKITIKQLTNTIEKISTKIDIGDNVKIPKKINSLVICSFIDSSLYNYQTQIPLSIRSYGGANNSYSNYSFFKQGQYTGRKNMDEKNSFYITPSPNEFYKNSQTPFLCFKEEIDCDLIKDMELDNLGLYNIKIKNINKLTNVKNLYLNNVEFLDGNTFSNKLILNELGINNCKTISSKMLSVIIEMSQANSLKKIYVKDSNVKKTDLPTKIEIIE